MSLPDPRWEIARIVEAHLDEILDRTMEAFRAELPTVKTATPQRLELIRSSTRRATLSFLALYADRSSPARVVLDRARAATVGAAGEIFERDEIVAMLRIGRQVIFQIARDFVQQEMGEDAAREADVEAAMATFLNELEIAERQVAPTSDAMHHLLAATEHEEPDIK